MKVFWFVVLVIGLACFEFWDLSRCDLQIQTACMSNYDITDCIGEVE